jgi:hypothetical protein
VTAIGIDEIAVWSGHKYLTVVYQINQGIAPTPLSGSPYFISSERFPSPTFQPTDSGEEAPKCTAMGRRFGRNS